MEFLKGESISDETCDYGLGDRYFNTLEEFKNEITQVDAFTGVTETACDLKQHAILWAMELQRSNVTENDTVLVCCGSCFEEAAITLGILFIGAQIMSIDPEMDTAELNAVFEGITPLVMFCDKRVAISIGRLKNKLHAQTKTYILGRGTNTVANVYENQIDPQFKPISIEQPKSKIAFMVVTEGVTDTPKLIKLSHHAIFERCKVLLDLIGNAKKVISYFSLTGSSQVILICSSFERHFIRVIPRPFVERDVCRIIHDMKIDFAILGTDKAMKLTNYYDEDRDHNIDCLQTILIGGSSTSARNFAFVLNTLEKKTLSIYGCAEAGFIAAVKEADAAIELQKPGTVGKVLPGVHVKIVDFKTDKPVKTDTWGELLCSVPGMCSGYYNPKGNKDAFDGNYFRTGDVAQYDEQGCIYMQGRLMEIFICKGHIFAALNIEEVMYLHPHVVDAACVSNGQLILLYCVLDDQNVTIKSLYVYLYEKLPKYMAPAKIYILNDLPKTPNGKIKKYLLKTILPRISIIHD